MKLGLVGSLVLSCDPGSSGSSGASVTGTTGGPATSGTTTDAVDGTQTGAASECVPPPAECSDPEQGDDPTCSASVAAGNAISHAWSIEGQGSVGGLCTPQAGDPLVLDCVRDGGSTFTVTIQLSAPEAVTLPWDETDEVRVTGWTEFAIGGHDSVLTVRSTDDELLLAAVHLDWNDPPGTEGLPFSVEARRDVCCAVRLDIALEFGADGEAPLVLYSDTYGEFSTSTGNFTAFVSDAWFDPCPEPVTDLSTVTFDYFVVRG